MLLFAGVILSITQTIHQPAIVGWFSLIVWESEIPLQYTDGSQNGSCSSWCCGLVVFRGEYFQCTIAKTGHFLGGWWLSHPFPSNKNIKLNHFSPRLGWQKTRKNFWNQHPEEQFVLSWHLLKRCVYNVVVIQSRKKNRKNIKYLGGWSEIHHESWLTSRFFCWLVLQPPKNAWNITIRCSQALQSEKNKIKNPGTCTNSKKQ